MLAGILLGLGASACWAVANVAVQRSARRVGTFRGLLWAQLVGVALVAAVAPAVDHRAVPVTAALVPWLLVAGATALLAYVCMFYAFEHGRLTIAVPVMSSWSVIAGGMSLLLFRAPVHRIALGGAACVISGALVVSRYSQQRAASSSDGAAGTPRWVVASAAAAIGFGLLIPTIGRLAPALGPLGAVAVTFVADIALGLPLAWWFRVRLAPPPLAAWLPVALAGLFETAGFACIALASRRAPLVLVSPLASLASAFTVLYAWLVLRERPPRPVLLGAALASAGIILMAL
jgi:drug/metabolite transporter (DMT)-like permease